jgi:predicted HTH transcriptional regulator
MTPQEIQELVADVQRRHGESDSIEVKAARGGTPKRLYESLSAFANRPGGGVVLFGLDESGDFAVSGVGNAQRLQEEITHLASSEMEPPLRPNFAVDEIGGETVIAVENRGSGIKSMLQALRDANLEPPKFDDRRSSFLVTFRNHTLLNPQAIAWLNQFANHPLNDRQRLALVYLRQHGHITNPDYRRLNRVDPLVAGRELRSLVESALVEQEGTRRWTSYRLQVSPDVPAQIELSTEEKEILAWISEKKSITNKECRQLLGVGPTRAYYLLKRLCDAKHIKSTGAGKGRSYSLP